MHVNSDTDRVAATLLSLERTAMDRWNQGDVEGCLEIYAQDVTYFDPITATRIDGWQVVHVHWSFTKHPAFAAMSPESAEARQT